MVLQALEQENWEGLCLKCPNCLLQYYRYPGTCTHCSALRLVAASCGFGQFAYNKSCYSPGWHCKPWNNKIGKDCVSSARNVSCNITVTWALVHTAAHCGLLRPRAVGQFGYNNSPLWHCNPWNNNIGKGCASSARNVSCNNSGTWALVHTVAHCGLLRPCAA